MYIELNCCILKIKLRELKSNSFCIDIGAELLEVNAVIFL